MESTSKKIMKYAQFVTLTIFNSKILQFTIICIVPRRKKNQQVYKFTLKWRKKIVKWKKKPIYYFFYYLIKYSTKSKENIHKSLVNKPILFEKKNKRKQPAINLLSAFYVFVYLLSPFQAMICKYCLRNNITQIESNAMRDALLIIFFLLSEAYGTHLD